MLGKVNGVGIDVAGVNSSWSYTLVLAYKTHVHGIGQRFSTFFAPVSLKGEVMSTGTLPA